jgi:glucosamine--fructose-6-phosphate aminotransferase (isomerizing)
MLKEIYEQPRVIRNIAKNYDSQAKELAGIIKKARGTFFIGAGTAFHACIGGVYLFSAINRHHINTALASEFNYLEEFLNEKSLVVALSQSGETIDVIEPLKRAKEKGSRIIAITNSLGSTIYRMADVKVLLGAGPEKAVASTKAYTAKLALILLVCFAMLGDLEKGKELLLKAADFIEKFLEEERGRIKKLARLLIKSSDLYTIGRGISYPIALEAALKIKEVSYIHAEGLAGGELKHGTIALIEEGTPCLVFAPDDQTYSAIIANSEEIKSRGGIIIGISPRNNRVFDYWIKSADLSYASYLTSIVPAQLLAYYLAVLKRLDPDKPRNLAKSVTVK